MASFTMSARLFPLQVLIKQMEVSQMNLFWIQKFDCLSLNIHALFDYHKEAQFSLNRRLHFNFMPKGLPDILYIWWTIHAVVSPLLENFLQKSPVYSSQLCSCALAWYMELLSRYVKFGTVTTVFKITFLRRDCFTT